MMHEAQLVGGPLAGRIYAMRDLNGEPEKTFRIDSRSELTVTPKAEDAVPIQTGSYCRDHKPFRPQQWKYRWAGWEDK